MGAWGAKAFENDSALDWLAELDSVHGLRQTLARAANSEGDAIDVDDGSAVIAAAELVAATLGHARRRLTTAASAWLAANAAEIGADDVTLAGRAVGRVLGRSSELRKLWDEGSEESAWHVDVRELLVQLGGEPPLAQAAATTWGIGDDQAKQALLAFLSMRDLPPSAAQEARIEACRDRAELHGWLARVVRSRHSSGSDGLFPNGKILHGGGTIVVFIPVREELPH